MDGFLKWFYAFITNIIEGFWQIISGLFNGVVQIFNIPFYGSQLSDYASGFTVVDWILAILSMILVTAFFAALVFMAALLIRKYIRFRKDVVSEEDLLEELASLHRSVVQLTEEKERILALQVTRLGVSPEKIADVLHLNPVDLDIGAEPLENESAVSAAAEDSASAPKKIESGGSKRFFRLSEVDDKYEYFISPNYQNNFTLAQLCDNFRNFACSSMHLYYDQKTIRLMFAGMASTKMILLQGISGTGKTSLPYSMGKFFSQNATIASVQPSWRDRTELFGYFNEFTKKFNETEVLKRIYEASYNDDINLIILDEMNIARVEYYFAEMLSILEMPDPGEWKIDLVTSSWDTDPKRLVDGKLVIPQNVWYIGTANNDDSTFAVSDKVYDRAFVINLDSKGVPFDAPPVDSTYVSYDYVSRLFEEAVEQHPVSAKTLERINHLDIYVISKFRIAFGNRIVKQLKVFIPAYVACGGTELEGVDYILATKVFRKFESLNLSLIRDEIPDLIAFIEKSFGKNSMKESVAYLERLRKLY